MASALFDVGQKAFVLFCFATASQKPAEVTNCKPKYDIKVCEGIINKTRKKLGHVKRAV